MLYAAKLLADNTPKGIRGDYTDIPQVVAIILLEGSLMFPESEGFLSACTMRWETTDGPVPGPDRIVLIAAELDKVLRLYNADGMDAILKSESSAWLYLLAAGYKNPEEVERIVEEFPTIEEFAARYGMALGDPLLKRAYDRQWMNALEYNSIMNQARRDSLAEGRAEGRAEAISALRAAGMDAAADLLETAIE